MIFFLFVYRFIHPLKQCFIRQNKPYRFLKRERSYFLRVIDTTTWYSTVKRKNNYFQGRQGLDFVIRVKIIDKIRNIQITSRSVRRCVPMNKNLNKTLYQKNIASIWYWTLSKSGVKTQNHKKKERSQKKENNIQFKVNYKSTLYLKDWTCFQKSKVNTFPKSKHENIYFDPIIKEEILLELKKFVIDKAERFRPLQNLKMQTAEKNVHVG